MKLQSCLLPLAFAHSILLSPPVPEIDESAIFTQVQGNFKSVEKKTVTLDGPFKAVFSTRGTLPIKSKGESPTNFVQTMTITGSAGVYQLGEPDVKGLSSVKSGRIDGPAMVEIERIETTGLDNKKRTKKLRASSDFMEINIAKDVTITLRGNVKGVAHGASLPTTIRLDEYRRWDL